MFSYFAHGFSNAIALAQIYAASLLVVDPDGPAERGYLALLADRLNLDPGLVTHIHGQASRLV